MLLLFESILTFIWAVYFFETYLDLRQRKKLQEKDVPAELQSIVTQETFLKAQSYGLYKSTYGLITSFIFQVENTIILVFGGLPFLWNYSVHLLDSLGYGADYEILGSLVFLLLGTLYEMVVHLPFGMYYTFVIEEKHGFNKQTLGLYFTDKIKGLLVGMVIGIPAVSALLYIVKWGGSLFYLYAWAFLFLFTLFMVTIYPNVIAPLFNKFTLLEEGELRTAIEKLAASISFPLTKLFVVDGSKRSGHSNAYFYGFFKNKRIVLYDTLLKQLNLEETVAVLGHELGHWKMNHTLKLMIIGQIQVFVSFYLFGQTLNWDIMYTSFGFTDKPTIIGMIIFFQFIMSPVDNVLSFVMNIISRTFEFQADAFGKKLGYAEQLKSGLIKLQLENLGNMNPDSWYSTYHYSHPPLLERLKAMGKSQ